MIYQLRIQKKRIPFVIESDDDLPVFFVVVVLCRNLLAFNALSTYKHRNCLPQSACVHWIGQLIAATIETDEFLFFSRKNRSLERAILIVSGFILPSWHLNNPPFWKKWLLFIIKLTSEYPYTIFSYEHEPEAWHLCGQALIELRHMIYIGYKWLN